MIFFILFFSVDASTLIMPSHDSRVEFTDDEGENNSETNSDDSSCNLTIYDGYLCLFLLFFPFFTVVKYERFFTTGLLATAICWIFCISGC